jgi:broad specificity phosphatase PhoE
MKTILIIILSLFISADAAAQHDDKANSKNETVLIFTRHAEKEKGDDTDPSLNEAGRKRAIKLMILLKQYDSINGIYSTDYNRTRETAQPVAKHFELPVTIYNPKELDNFKDELLEQHRSETVLIVGHSNTTPHLINLVMGEKRLEQFDENDHSNLYIIKIVEDGSPILQHYIY